MNTYSNLNLSDHAVRRIQQRGISIETLEFVIAEADVWLHAYAGCYSVRISKKKLARLSKEGASATLIERAANVVIVIDPEDFNKIITVLHDHGTKRSRRFRTQKPCCAGKSRRRSRKRKNLTPFAFGEYPKANLCVASH